MPAANGNDDETERIAGLRLEEVIGEGVYSRVYRGVGDEDSFAVKVQKQDRQTISEDATRRFLREGALLARLEHPVLPRVWTVGEVDGRKYLVMDYFEGETLRERLDTRRVLSEDLVRRIGGDIADGLVELHGAGFIHRDIKPSNIVWDGDRARLVDFGLVAETRPLDGPEDSSDHHVGTFLYASPEQVRALKRPVTVRSDLYSLGAVLHECCTGRPPFTPDSLDDLIRHHATESPRPIGDRAPDLPEALAELIDRLLSKEPDERPGSAGDVRDHFRGLPSDDWDEPAPSESLGGETSGAQRFRAYATARDDDVERIHGHWLRCRKDAVGGCVLVRAMAGSGAHYFTDHVRRRVGGEAETVLTNTASTRQTEPLMAVRQLMESFFTEGRPEETSRDEHDGLAKIARAVGLSEATRRAVPGLSDSSDDGRDGWGLEPEQFYDELARYLGAVGEQFGPTAIFVNNVEDVDAASRAVLERLCGRIRKHPVWLFFTVDPSARSGSAFADALKARLSSERAGADNPERERQPFLEVSLDPLSENGVRNFVRRFFDTELDDPRLVSQLKEISGGSPMIVEQLLDILVEQGVVTPDWGGWEVDHGRLSRLELPEDSRDLLIDRLGALPDTVRRLCSAAAVWGLSFSIPPVASAMEDSIEEAQDFAETAVLHGLVVRRDDDSDGSHQFVHESVRRVFVDQLPKSDRRRFHQRYAEWLEANRQEWSFRLARHYREGNGADPIRQMEVCLEAGERAVDQYAYERAKPYLETAIETAESADLDPPQAAMYLLGETCAALEETNRARQWLQRAESEASNRLDRVECRLAESRIDASRLDIAAIDESARSALELLGEPLPSSKAGWLALAMFRYAKVLYWRHVSSPTPAQGDRRRELRLRSEAYRLLSLVGNFREDVALTLAQLSGRLLASIPLGPSMPLLEAYGTELNVYVFRERYEAAEQKIEEMQRVADEIGAPRAEAYVDGGRVFSDDVGGDPVGAVELGESLLDNRADQLTYYNRSITLLVVIVSLGLRGHSRRVLHWFDRWTSLQGIDPDDPPPSPIYGTVHLHARLCGDDELADKLREASRKGLDEDENVYVAKMHWSGAIMDDVLREADPAQIEHAIEKRRALGTDASGILYNKRHFIYAMYGRRYILDHGQQEDAQRREEFDRAVAHLEEAESEHPTFRGHLSIGRAEMHRRDDDLEGALAELGRAESIAERHANPWVKLEVERLRAKWLEEKRRSRLRRHHAEAALRQAESMGWGPTATHLRDAYGVGTVTEDSPATSRTSSGSFDVDRQISSSDARVSSREVELERRLSALVEVSQATSSILEPDEVAEVVVDAAIQVLGARRGMLFLEDADQEGKTLREAEPHVVRTAGDEEVEEVATFSRTVVDKVAATGEPTVLRGTEEGARLGAESVVTEQMRSIVAAPFGLDDALVGIIYLDNHLAEGVFGEGDVRILQAMANHIPSALQTARSAQLEVEIASERRRREFSEHLREFARTINAMLDVPNILEHLVREVREVVSADEIRAGYLSGDELKLACVGDPDSLATRPFAETRQFDDGELIAALLESGTATRLEQVDQDDRAREPTIPRGAKSWLGVPLLSGDRRAGVMTLSSKEAGELGPGTVDRLMAFADQAGIAIEKTRLANEDPLTGVFNRRRFFEVASDAFEQADLEAGALVALMIDLDDFKSINDAHGHAAGDAVLETVASVCQEALRSRDVVGRYGGDEFAVLLRDIGATDAVETVVPRLQKRLTEASCFYGGAELEFTTSIGVAGVSEKYDSIHALLESADAAVYSAKEAGKHAVAVDEPEARTET